MKQFISIFMLMILWVSVAFTQKNIQFFQGSWKDALEQAAKEDKPIFVDAYTVWCGPCKYMANYVFTVDSVAEYYNQHFINYKIDMERGEGPAFASQYRVTAYPTLLYINSKGKVIHRVLGAKSPDQFLQEGRRAMMVYNYK
jgi:thiol:disulfide interchange protein